MNSPSHVNLKLLPFHDNDEDKESSGKIMANHQTIEPFPQTIHEKSVTSASKNGDD
jgi:hypothetical protein